MTRQQFLDYLASANFRELFIREMGWNNPPASQARFALDIDGRPLHFAEVAERNGFQVLTCAVDSLPTASMCKKIDIRLRRQAHDYICIFILRGTQHHLWAVPVRKVEKRDIVVVEYEQPSQADFLLSKLDGLTFDLDEQTTIVDVVERVQMAFLVNSEKLTKDFYAGFRKEHTAFARFISGIEGHQAERDRQWYTSVMLNRLMFCYFIQKKGFLDGDTDYLHRRLRQHREEQQGKGKTFFQSFYRGFLVTLFHVVLNAPQRADEFRRRYGRIPYLNGGMFDEHQIERDYADLDIADEAFESLFNFFDRWRWHLDDRITATGRDINPDVLGYIFEQYINDRAQMGAYYTKEDITEYIGRNTIVPYLLDQTLKASAAHAKPLWHFLQQSGDRYIYDAVKRGVELPLPDYIEQGIDTTGPGLLERRARWNERAAEPYALPTEIWRETVERRQRHADIKGRIERGEIASPNDFITYNLDIRQCVYDYLLQTSDRLFVKHFYAAIRRVAILDPTCGSGAFLFAALNILEPLYEVCIGRMQEFRLENKNWFEDELAEVEGKYRSNVQYFIYKSIILRNLYGVDIMVEATEVAKLRLFLKLVAVVDVDLRHPNLGLDPLPDIDFNIRCGNTLVGYATEKELERDLTENLTASIQRQGIEDEMEVVARTYTRFKELQLQAGEDLAAFKAAKKELTKRLAALNGTLNRLLHGATAEKLTYDDWLQSHQPFHWIAEFYEIIHGHGGFDVIIGNPPYVEFSHSNKIYGKLAYETLKTYNLHALCSERSKQIIHDSGKYGMILPIGAFSTQNMKPLMSYMEKEATLWLSFYHFRPSRLFDGGKGASIPTTIILSQKSSFAMRYSTGVKKFTPETRVYLFSNCSYTADNSDFRKRFDFCFPKISNDIENSILTKVVTNKPLIAYKSNKATCQEISYRTAGGLYWKIVLNRPFPYESTSNKTSYLQEGVDNNVITSFLNSSLQWLICTISFDTLNFKDYYIFNLPFSYSELSREIKEELAYLCNILMDNYSTNAKHKYRGDTPCYEITANLAKPIIDEIDKVLAKHYGFTEEELDFIINYDIKYRMGDELDGEG